MKEKWTPHIIAVTALVVFVVLGLASVSAPAGVSEVPAYAMETMPEADILTGKTAVVFNLAMAERILPRRATGSSGGFLANSLIHRSYNNLAASDGIRELSVRVLAERQAAFSQGYIARYQELFGVNPVRASFNFDNTVTFNYFRSPSAAVRQRIIDACSANNTDFAIVMVAQVVSQETMSAPTDTAPSVINAEVYLFNRNGELVALGKTTTSTVGIHHREARFIEGYGTLLDDAFENITLMLPALGGNGPSTATKPFVP